MNHDQEAIQALAEHQEKRMQYLPTMSKLPLCVILLMTAQTSMAFVSRSIVVRSTTGSDLVSSREGPPLFGPKFRLSTPRRYSNYRRFMAGICKLRASSKGRESSSDISRRSTTTTQHNAEPHTNDLKELASRIDKNSSRGLARGDQGTNKSSSRPRYQFGVGKNLPVVVSTDDDNNNNNKTIAAVEQKEDIISAAMNWVVPQPATKRQQGGQRYDMGLGKHAPINKKSGGVEDDNSRKEYGMQTTTRLLPNRGEESARLAKAVWDEGHFVDDGYELVRFSVPSMQQQQQQQNAIMDYRQIDLSIPPSVYSLGSSSPSSSSSNNSSSSQSRVDLVWDLMRQEAQAEAAREPLLVSFLYSTILNHPTLESALSFHLANRLSSPAMLSTQIMSLIQEALDADPDFRRSVRADILAVRDRDPACHCLPDVFLYFKGFHALQTYRAAHYLWKSGRRVLAHYLQSQVSQHFQIDIREYLVLFFFVCALCNSCVARVPSHNFFYLHCPHISDTQHYYYCYQ